MKKYLIIALSMLALITGVVSCSKEPSNPIERTYTVSGFNTIEGGEQFRFTITQGGSFSVKAKGERRDLDDLVLQKTGTHLKVLYNRFLNKRKIVDVNITLPTLDSLVLSGQASAGLSNITETRSVTIISSGQAVCRANVNAPQFLLEASGQSRIEFLGGTTVDIEADASGQSFILCYGLTASRADLVASGQSVIKASPSQRLAVNASGQSAVYYQGNPPVKNITQTGEARVIQE